MKEYIYPKKVIYNNICVKNINNLFKKKQKQITTNEPDTIDFYGNGKILLDFGKEICGGIRILTYLVDGQTKININFGESASEAMSEFNEQNHVNAHTVIYLQESLIDYSDMGFGETGFRFVCIDFVNSGSVKIKSILAENNIFSKKPIYEYKGNDDCIKKIFGAAKRTGDLCAQNNFLWDGIKRDRLVWAGDLYLEALGMCTLYGPITNITNSIDFLINTLGNNDWINDVPSYSMFWILTVMDYCSLINNNSLFIKYKAEINNIFLKLINNIDKHGEFVIKDCFVDLNFIGNQTEYEAFKAIFLIVNKKYIEKCTESGFDTEAVKRLKTLDLSFSINTFKDAGVIALKYLAKNEISSEDKDILYNLNMSNVSILMSYFVLDAINKIFGKELAVEKMRLYYGKMIDLGATTFWENFDTRWSENTIKVDELPVETKRNFHSDYGHHCFSGYRKSLCHGWGVGIICLIKSICE